MTRGRKVELGPLVAFIESAPSLAQERETYAFVQSIVDGLKAMRERRGLTQTALAKELGVTQGRVSQIESGLLDHAPNLEMIQRYAAACGYQLKLVFDETAVSDRRRAKAA